MDGALPLDRTRNLPDEGVASLLGGGDEGRVHIAHNRDFGIVEGELLDVGGEAVLGGLHQRAMEGSADWKQDGTLGAALLGQLGGAFDGSLTSGDDSLVG